MTDVFTYSPRDLLPSREEVLRSQGYPEGAEVSSTTAALFREATAEFLHAAAPVAVVVPIPVGSFLVLYRGEGLNAACTPVGDIAPHADKLALFVATIGEPVCRQIRKGFDERDYAKAYMLDTIASVAADKTAELAQRRFEDSLKEAGNAGHDVAVLRYSPGYCGWHVTGQKKLFEYAKPDRIGVSLTESCLMQPLKSVSGVIIAARREIHDFDATYPCCAECNDHGCRSRIEQLYAK
jgi:hypothetical protein